MDSQFNFIIADSYDYNDLFAEIYYGDEFICIINQEKGVMNMELELFPTKNNSKWIFDLAQFQHILQKAKEALERMQNKQD